MENVMCPITFHVLFLDWAHALLFCLFVCFICIPSPTRLTLELLALRLYAFGSGCSLRPHKAGSDSNERAQSCCFIDLLHTHWQ